MATVSVVLEVCVRVWFRVATIAIVLVTGMLGYHHGMARIGSGPVPSMASGERQADRIIVDKSDRRLELRQGNAVLATYRISLGGAADAGPKRREGDQKTPEGVYAIDWRNPKSMAHISLHISYPNEADQAAADATGHSPGGNIMIHGLPNGWGWLGPVHHLWDWTDGCIAVTNKEMQEIWSKVPNGTPIEIRS